MIPPNKENLNADAVFDMGLILTSLGVYFDFIASHTIGFLSFVLLVMRIYDTKAAQDFIAYIRIRRQTKLKKEAENEK